MSSKPVVLVTGGTGYVGSHIISQLLEQKKYTIRATARKTSKLLSMFPNAGADLDAVQVPSLTADHSEVLKGVWALIHCASPLPLVSTGKEIVEAAYEGAVNVVQAAIKAGVKKIVVTGTFLSLIDPDLKTAYGTEPLSEKSWGVISSVEEIDLEKGNPYTIYMQTKALSEKKIWAIAHENPDVDLTVLIPSAIWGPFIPTYPTPADQGGLGSIGTTLYTLISGTYPPFPSAVQIDVRDCAKFHLQSLSTPPLKDGQDKRFLTEVPKSIGWKEITDIIRKGRPELASRLPAEDVPLPPGASAPHDSSFTEKVLGWKETDFISVEKTVLDSIDELVKWEKTNKAAKV